MSYQRIIDLIVKSKTGDKESLKELIITYENLIKKYVNNYFINGYENEDLEQIAKLAIIMAVQRYDITKGANFTGFLNIVLRNTFVNMLDKKENKVLNISLNKVNNQGAELSEILEDDFNLEENFLNKDNLDKLRKALKTLTPEEKQIIYAAYKGHGGLKEYSRASGISYRVCGLRRDRIVEKLRRVMEN